MFNGTGWQTPTHIITTGGAPGWLMRAITAELGGTSRESPSYLRKAFVVNSHFRLPDSLQLSVCQKGIRLEDFLYSIFWPDGSWCVSRCLLGKCDGPDWGRCFTGICEYGSKDHMVPLSLYLTTAWNMSSEHSKF